MAKFVHLRLHSDYSLVDGLVRIKPLMTRVAELEMPAITISDHHNFFGLIKAYKIASDLGIKLIIGVDLHVADPSDNERHHELCLLAQNGNGYQNLIRLISRAYRQGQYLGRPQVQLSWMSEYSEGIIALSGGRKGDVGQALLHGRPKDARSLLLRWQKLFPNRFYLELQRTGREDEESMYLMRQLG